jgi:phosphoglycerate dehydrogenase-like enzyme
MTYRPWLFKVEPLPEASRLWEQENLLLTAHNADFTNDYFALGWSIWRDNYDAHTTGAPLQTVVDKATGY